MAIPAAMDGRWALTCPGPSGSRLQHEAGFINEDEGTALTLSFFECQPLVFGPVGNGPFIALTSPLRGFWGLQPRRRRRCQMPEGR
jgi:hypothetical protein